MNESIAPTEILRKVQKLLALSGNNSNAEEAATAAAKAQALMDEYRITQAMLYVERDRDDEEEIVDFAKKDAPLDNLGSRLPTWRGALATILAKANQCYTFAQKKVELLTREVSTHIEIVGRPSDVDTVRYLYAYLVREIDRLVARDGRGCGKTWANNYRIGVVETISLRLRTQRAETERAMHEKVAADARALVLVDKALEKMKAVAAEAEDVARRGRKLGSSAASFRGDADARAQGREAGKSLRLSGTSKGALGSGKRAIGSGS
jgi:Protein of unknown function (DUF2786)